ncbi:rCG35198 [Rattus norvegicus]|uniref:RCG35198 n=1 Tax=Rattus norvegicus TaxID=10116 RepID=A6HLE2_RAT|nr:rCG35198 [Rattus norvegicus]
MSPRQKNSKISLADPRRMREPRGAGPDRDPTPRVPSENPHQVYHNPEDPILRTLDFREPPRVIPDPAGAGPGAGPSSPRE